jgi:hypothetical protein
MCVMARFALVAPFVILTACGLQKAGGLDEEPDGSIVDASKPEIAIDAVIVPTCDPKACPSDQYCTPDGCDYLPSCDAILAADPSATSRPYAIRTPLMKKPETALAYCAMDIAEAPGGWMLFARTNASATGKFGWTVPQPDLLSANPVYTFDITKLPPLNRGLITVRQGVLQIAATGPLVTFDFPNGFPSGQGGSTLATPGLKVLRPDSTCQVSTPPLGLSVMGLTSQTDTMFFSDAPGAGYGIGPGGFVPHLASSCSYDQNLGGKQILLFVK